MLDSDTLFSSVTICTQKHSHSFTLTQLDDGSHLEFHHLGLRKLHSFILTQLDDGSHLEFCHLEFRHRHLGFSHLSFLLSNSLPLAKIGSHHSAQKNLQSHSFWLNLMMAAILNSHILNSAILDSAILHKTLTQTNSFWLNLMMAAILNSVMLDSDIAILDSDTFLSSLRFSPKHSPSTLTLTQTNLIWFKHDSFSAHLDDGFHLEFCHLGISHFAQNSDAN